MARLTPETKRFLRKAVAGLPFLKRSEAKAELHRRTSRTLSNSE